MEIHKPKPVRNWREFLVELSIVVLGIIIAISLERTVEAWSWRHKVEDARKTIHAEISANEANFVMRGLSYKTCLDRQLQEAETILADLKAGRKPGRFTTFHATNRGPISVSEWEAQRAALTLTHFPPDEVAKMGRIYSWLVDFKIWGTQESDRWTDLAVLRDPPSGLGPSDFARLEGSLASVRHYYGLIELNALRVLALADALGVQRPVLDEARRRRFCSTNEEELFRRGEEDDALQLGQFR